MTTLASSWWNALGQAACTPARTAPAEPGLVRVEHRRSEREQPAHPGPGLGLRDRVADQSPERVAEPEGLGARHSRRAPWRARPDRRGGRGRRPRSPSASAPLAAASTPPSRASRRSSSRTRPPRGSGRGSTAARSRSSGGWRRARGTAAPAPGSGGERPGGRGARPSTRPRPRRRPPPRERRAPGRTSEPPPTRQPARAAAPATQAGDPGSGIHVGNLRRSSALGQIKACYGRLKGPTPTPRRASGSPVRPRGS